MAGNAGSRLSIDSAVSPIITAMSPTNSRNGGMGRAGAAVGRGGAGIWLVMINLQHLAWDPMVPLQELRPASKPDARMAAPTSPSAPVVARPAEKVIGQAFSGEVDPVH